MRYWIIKNGESVGPFAPEELLAQGVGPQTKVWRKGLDGWTPFASVPEFATPPPFPTTPPPLPVPPVPPVFSAAEPEVDNSAAEEGVVWEEAIGAAADGAENAVGQEPVEAAAESTEPDPDYSGWMRCPFSHKKSAIAITVAALCLFSGFSWHSLLDPFGLVMLALGIATVASSWLTRRFWSRGDLNRSRRFSSLTVYCMVAEVDAFVVLLPFKIVADIFLY